MAGKKKPASRKPAEGGGVTESGNVTPPTNAAAEEHPADGLPPAHARGGESRSQCWERIRKEGRAAGMGKREAYERANNETERLFPPEPEPEPESEPEPPPAQPPAQPPAPAAPEPPPAAESGHVLGLGEVPADWPTLPPNASLQAEIAWVQASRVDVVELLPGGGSRVSLDRADQPAPSKAALAWLETSILFPSKFADVSVKATQHQADDAEAMRRERLSIAEVRGLLAEMVEAEAGGGGAT